MSCYHPMYRLDYDRAKRAGLSVSAWSKRTHNGGVVLSKDEGDFILSLNRPISEYVDKIPCGKCIGCRLDYSRTWANRCYFEMKDWSSNLFLTLTYDDANLPPPRPHFDILTGELSMRPALEPYHLTQFMKSYREKMSRTYDQDNIRFFACGEYGELRGRPHLHIIAFNNSLPDLKPHRDVKTRNKDVFDSNVLKDVWKKGRVGVSPANWETCAYVARYVTKKAKGFAVKEREEVLQRLLPGQAEMLESLNLDIEERNQKKIERERHILDVCARNPAPIELDIGNYQEELESPLKPGKIWQDEFVRMSRKPGIGRQFYERNKDVIYATDEMFIKRGGKVMSVKPARYFDELYDLDEPEKFADVKKKRREAGKIINANELAQTDLSEDAYLSQKELEHVERAKKLRRQLDD